MESLFWDSEGLKRVAEIVDDEIARVKLQGGQKFLAQKADISAQSITNLRLNRLNNAGKIAKRIEPDTLMKLAPHITNPATGQKFQSGWELLAIATGHASMASSSPKNSEHSMMYLAHISKHKGLKVIKEGMGGLSVEDFAARCSIPLEAMQEILAGRVPLKKEFVRIAAVIYPDSDTERLMEAYGLTFRRDLPKASGNGHALRQ